MSIALIDQDCLNNKKDFFFDLDIMKLASYYKTKREIVKLLLEVDHYTRYTKTYYIKNRFDYKLFDKLFIDPRIEYRGYAFSDYIPLERDIELAVPDTTIYDSYLRFNDNLPKRRIPKLKTSSFTFGNHARLSMDGKICNTPLSNILYKETESLYLYDYNIFTLEGWREYFKNFSGYKIVLKFPPITTSIKDIVYLFHNYDIKSENHSILNKILTKDEIDFVIELGKQYKDRLKIEFLQDLDIENVESYHSKLIYMLNTILALKHAHVRVHSYVDQHNINKETAFLNAAAYWSNRNHGDVSLKYFLYNIRKSAFKKFDPLAEENDTIKYLYEVKPSEWRDVL